MISRILIVKLLKFCVVGFSGLLIDFGITWLLKEKARINKYIANSTGFILAASSNFFWNRIWTFASRNQQIAQEYVVFVAISVIGLAINNFTVYLLTAKLKMNFYPAKLIAIAVTTLWNFSMNFLVTFAERT